ncbi:hypothetical protein QJS10_CPB12g00383 [Acorus calamus]|uniref:Protein kinase domain-containing protein n=1 Tax=Acorus calamus TaxID=4465 RepID=A0AAV9DM31_ACOCL|nr:hypothetical protein QJS10_CPB12g00383 [Acorus calamus]
MDCDLKDPFKIYFICTPPFTTCVSTFAATPLVRVIPDNLDLTKAAIGKVSIASVSGSIFSHLYLSGLSLRHPLNPMSAIVFTLGNLGADMWSFGITALELAHGHAPFSKYPPMKVFLMTMQNAPPVLHINREKKFRKSFRAMISTCLVKNLQARPSAERLLRHSVFKKARSQDYIVRTILEGLSTLGDHLKELKLKEDDMIEQQKIPDGKKEEMSQVVPAWLGCFPIKGDLIEAKVVYDQLSTMVKRILLTLFA